MENDTMFIASAVMIGLFVILMAAGSWDAIKLTVKSYKDEYMGEFAFNCVLVTIMLAITGGGAYALLYKIAEFNQWMNMV